MKKCLCCDNNIEKMNHYVCNECYKKIKELKKEFVLINNKELYKEYYRWLRNKNFTKNTKYKNEYQMKIIAIAEVIKDKYNDDQKIKDIIDHSNSQEINIETIKLNEAKEEENFNNELAKANEVDLEKNNNI